MIFFVILKNSRYEEGGTLHFVANTRFYIRTNEYCNFTRKFRFLYSTNV